MIKLLAFTVVLHHLLQVRLELRIFAVRFHILCEVRSFSVILALESPFLFLVLSLAFQLCIGILDEFLQLLRLE